MENHLSAFFSNETFFANFNNGGISYPKTRAAFPEQGKGYDESEIY